MPSTGNARAEQSTGRVINQDSSASATPKSSAMVGIASVSTVTGKVVANMPASATSSTHRG